ncbi:MAG: hypothetical protein HGB31_07120 [Erysipelotrichaceae bacterium]|nr:hypothetical protein [Erysipelotrichaceae bacterium]
MKTIFKIISRCALVIIMALAILSSLPVRSAFALGFAGGSGSVGDPYQINTMNQLNMVRYGLGYSYILTANIDLSDATASGGLYDNGGKGWQPIGDSTTPFTGNFDGGSYTISGLYINRVESSDAYTGLFGYLSGGSITDLILDGEVHGFMWTGALVGKVSGGKVEGVTNNADVTSYNAYGGGIAGSLVGTNGVILTCINNGNIGFAPSIATAWSIGGIVGAVDTEAHISDAINNGSVLGAQYIGGIAGSIKGTVELSTNYGQVDGQWAIGGIVGGADVDSLTALSINHGTITSEYDYVGGIVGGGSGVIYLSMNYGSINSYSNYIGGIIGGNGIGGRVSTVINYGNVLYLGSSTGLIYVGGIAGVNQDAITNAMNFGRVDSTVVSGGVVGGNDVNGLILNVSNSASVTGGGYSGGIVGRNQGLVQNVYSLNTSDGAMTLGSPSLGYMISGDVLGSIIGFNNGTLKQAYSLGNSINKVGETDSSSVIEDADLYFKGKNLILYNNSDDSVLTQNRLLVNRLSDNSEAYNELEDELIMTSWNLGVLEEYDFPTLYTEARIHYFSIIYFANGSTGTVPFDETIYVAGDSGTILGNMDLAITDKVFKGWNHQADGLGTGYELDDTYEFIDTDLNLYAQFEAPLPDTGRSSDVGGLFLVIGAVLMIISRKRNSQV